MVREEKRQEKWYRQTNTHICKRQTERYDVKSPSDDRAQQEIDNEKSVLLDVSNGIYFEANDKGECENLNACFCFLNIRKKS